MATNSKLSQSLKGNDNAKKNGAKKEAPRLSVGGFFANQTKNEKVTKELYAVMDSNMRTLEANHSLIIASGHKAKVAAAHRAAAENSSARFDEVDVAEKLVQKHGARDEVSKAQLRSLDMRKRTEIVNNRESLKRAEAAQAESDRLDTEYFRRTEKAAPLRAREDVLSKQHLAATSDAAYIVALKNQTKQDVRAVVSNTAASVKNEVSRRADNTVSQAKAAADRAAKSVESMRKRMWGK